MLNEERSRRLTRLKAWFPNEEPRFYDCGLILFGALREGPHRANKIANLPALDAGIYLENFRKNKIFIKNKVWLSFPIDNTEMLLAIGCGLGLIKTERREKSFND